MRVKLLIVITLLVLCTADLMAGRLEVEEFSFPADDIDLLVINADLAAGVFNIKSKKMEDLFEAKVEYDAKRIEVFADYERDGSTGYLDIGTDLNWHRSIDTDDNLWDASISTGYPVDLAIDMGACEASLNLGGLRLEYLDIDLGAADGKLTFDEPNPIAARKILIDAGAAKFEVTKLGNAGFERFVFDGGVGKFKIDFSGKYSTKSRAEISIGLGKAVIFIPRDLPVRIDAESNFLSSVDFENAEGGEIEDDYYESEDFRDSDFGLELEIDVGLGSVDIIWID
jgi:hypothetical protein